MTRDRLRAAATLEANGAPTSLEARGIVHRYGAVLALDHVDLHVPAGACVALVGESGSGKTTLLRCFNRMLMPQSGRITVGGTDVSEQPVEALRRRMGYVPQHGGLLPHWRVLRNVALVPTLLGRPDADRAAREALEIAGLPARDFGMRFPHELSGGQRQRVALARALAAHPSVVLLDEPFGALDAISRAELQGTFEAIRAASPLTTLLVTHDLAEAARLADTLVVMRAGRVEQRGTLRDLRTASATPYVADLLARALAGAERVVASV